MKLYDLYSRAMYNLCLRMIGDAHHAEEVLQDLFLDVFAKANSFRSESSIGAWIRRIAINKCLNKLKQKQLDWIALEDDVDFVEEEANEEPIWSMEEISHSINSLPTGFRVIITLYLIEGYDHQEIAQILGISAGTSKSQYSRAKQKLKKNLVQNYGPARKIYTAK